MILTDTHCHLYSEEFDADIEAVLQRAEAESVKKFYLPGIDSTAIAAMMELEKPRSTSRLSMFWKLRATPYWA